MTRRFVETLDPADLTPTETLCIDLLAAIFVYVESDGSCFDVLVREAIERGERAPATERSPS